jgi:hypothetical protein
MWDVDTRRGENDPDVGAAFVSDGFDVWYVGLDGDSVIGIGGYDSFSSSSFDDLLDEDSHCLIAGGIHYYTGDGDHDAILLP